MYKALCETMEQAPKGATSKHFYMAALNFAHSAILRRCEETSQ
jgi:hypothetical protein